jgi:hypothetical protein
MKWMYCFLLLWLLWSAYLSMNVVDDDSCPLKRAYVYERNGVIQHLCVKPIP